MPHLSLQSGVPTVAPSGVLVGATDFREFSLGVGLPVGITAFGSATSRPDPNLVSIGNDPLEDFGNHFAMTGRGGENWGFGLDSFFGLMAEGEMLVRIRCDYIINSFSIGAAAGMAGFNNTDWEAWIGAQEKRVFPGSGTDSVGKGSFPGFGNTMFGLAAGVIQQPEIAGISFNVRVRKIPNGGDPSRDDWEVRSWYGTSAGAEPVLPDDTATSVFRTGGGFEAIGWGQLPGFPANLIEQKIRFLSFSVNPLVEPAPFFDDIADVSPWVPSNRPLGSTWEVAP